MQACSKCLCSDSLPAVLQVFVLHKAFVATSDEEEDPERPLYMTDALLSELSLQYPWLAFAEKDKSWPQSIFGYCKLCRRYRMHSSEWCHGDWVSQEFAPLHALKEHPREKAHKTAVHREKLEKENGFVVLHWALETVKHQH